MFDFDKVINRQGTYCTQWDYIADRFGVSDLLPFTISDMDFSTAPVVLEAISERVKHGVFGYSRWQHDDFYSAITHWYKSRFSTAINVNQLVFCPSVIYAAAQLIRQWSNTGDNVVIHTPAYDGFYKIIKANHRNVVETPLKKDTNGEWQMDLEHFESVLSHPKTKVLLLCSPHNPTGKVWSLAELKLMAELAAKYGVKVISDEIHMDMCWHDDKPHIPWQNVALGEWAVVTSASKSFNIPALTGAYAFIGQSQDRDDFLYHLKNVDSISAPAILSVIAHMAAYQSGAPWLDDLKSYVLGNLNYLESTLNQAFPTIGYQIPQSTYLAWIDLNALQIDDNRLQRELIDNQKLAIMPGTTYGEYGKGYLRLNVACARSKVEDGTQRLIKALNVLYAK